MVYFNHVKRTEGKRMFYKYESTLDNDLIFWSNATADLRHNGEIGEDELPDELLHALNELWTVGQLVSCYLVVLKGRYGIALESIYDRDFAESLGITYGELVKRVEKKANYISREYPETGMGTMIRIIPRSSARLPKGSLMGRKGIWYCLRS